MSSNHKSACSLGNFSILWTVKENQDTLYPDLERLFAPEPVVKGFSPASHDDFRTFTTFDKGHGRHEWRTIMVSSALQDYLDWQQVAQVFKLETRFRRVADGKTFQQVLMGLPVCPKRKPVRRSY